MSKPAQVTLTTHIHVRGQVSASVSNIDSTGPYAVIDLGRQTVLFPDAEALDSLIDQATAVRDLIAGSSQRERVRAIHDDRPVPWCGTLLARLDEYWAAVQWDGNDRPTIDALDELTGADR
jgi:hypothetical protein